MARYLYECVRNVCVYFAGGVLLGLIEGVSILMTKLTADQFLQGMDSLQASNNNQISLHVTRVDS
jgi:hypothetical protein